MVNKIQECQMLFQYQIKVDKFVDLHHHFTKELMLWSSYSRFPPFKPKSSCIEAKIV